MLMGHYGKLQAFQDKTSGGCHIVSFQKICGQVKPATVLKTFFHLVVAPFFMAAIK